MNDAKNRSILAGTMITAGCTIGAGMFSLPVVASGMWFSVSMVVMVVIWALNYYSSLVLLEINMQYRPGASFDTFVTDILGKKWNLITGLGIAFLLYILLYAYFSAFGNMASQVIEWKPFGEGKWSSGSMSLVLGCLLGAIVWRSTKFVGLLSTILVFGMALAYILSMAGLSVQAEATKLFDPGLSVVDRFPFMWAAFPYFLTSFGFSSVVPSLYKFFGKNVDPIVKSIRYGSLIALLVYAIFIFACFGIISRNDFLEVNRAGGNMGDLVGALTQNSQGNTINFMLTLFSNFAIISSFLGVGLSLFDYLADMIGFADDLKGRTYTALLTFLPAGLASFFFPHGFIAAIGFAGLVMVLSYFIVPFLMVWKTRALNKEVLYRVKGGKILLITILVGSLIVVFCHIMYMLGALPMHS